MLHPSDSHAHLKQFDRLRTFAICAVGLAGICFATISLLSRAQPIVSAIALGGLLLLPWVILRPFWGLLLFLWLSHTIDAVKRLVYALSHYSQSDIASILIVPVLVAAALYLKIFFLKWFGDRSSPPVRMFKLWPIVIAMAGATIFTLRGGLDFQSLVANYAFICYIPAGIAVPYILYSVPRQQQYARTILIIVLVVGIYGLIQAIHGPWDYEVAYMRSGYTITIISLEDVAYFRAFSLLNNGSTFAGVLAMGTLLSFVYLCREDGRIRFRKSAVFLCIFTTVLCFAATQRGALICFLITLAIIPLLDRPKLFLVATGFGLVGFAALIKWALPLKEFIYVGTDFLTAQTNSEFLRQNSNLLTFGQRLDGFGDMANPALWTPFGFVRTIGGENTGAHDLLSNSLEWFGYVGTSIIVLLGILIVYNGLRGIQRLKHRPATRLWCQANLAIICFMLIWGILLGPSMHVTPMNFYFWTAIGNVLFATKVLADEPAGIRPPDQPAITAPSLIGPKKLTLHST